MKIWAISDTHAHELMLNPPDVDVVCFAGDASNSGIFYLNEPEVRNFMHWMANLPIKHKIFVAGNHDTSVEKRYITPADFHNMGITYLENQATTIENVKFWGSPITPTFGVDWAFNKDRAKIHKVWDNIPLDTDVLITHGPPKGILDVSYDRTGKLEHCGCSNLRKKVEEVKPTYHIFGHIHNMKGITNQGTFCDADTKIKYVNASIVEDGRFGRITNNGQILLI